MAQNNEIRYLNPPTVEVRKKKYCRFKKAGIKYVDYKDAEFLKRFLNEQGKILPRRLTGTSLKFQRKVAQAVKRARHLALLPYGTDLMKSGEDSYMEIILKKDVANLGHADDIVNVKTGYAVNYLIPQGYAIMATASAKKVLAENLRQRAHKIAKFTADAEALAAKLAETVVKVSAKVSETGKIYGSVTTAQLAEALVAAGIEVDKKDITVAEAAKELGTYEATVKCYKDVKGTFKYEVVAE